MGCRAHWGHRSLSVGRRTHWGHWSLSVSHRTHWRKRGKRGLEGSRCHRVCIHSWCSSHRGVRHRCARITIVIRVILFGIRLSGELISPSMRCAHSMFTRGIVCVSFSVELPNSPLHEVPLSSWLLLARWSGVAVRLCRLELLQAPEDPGTRRSFSLVCRRCCRRRLGSICLDFWRKRRCSTDDGSNDECTGSYHVHKAGFHGYPACRWWCSTQERRGCIGCHGTRGGCPAGGPRTDRWHADILSALRSEEGLFVSGSCGEQSPRVHS